MTLACLNRNFSACCSVPSASGLNSTAAVLARFFGENGYQSALPVDAEYKEQVEGLARLAMINYGIIRGIQEGFILDSLEALDYMIDAQGKSTAIEKEAAERTHPDDEMAPHGLA